MKQLLCRVFLLSIAVCGVPATAAPSGTLDPSFGNGFGTQNVGFNLGGSWNDGAAALLRGPDARLYLAGSVEFDTNRYGVGITRLHHDGSIDETFGEGGKAFHSEPAYKSIAVYDAAMQADGKLVVAGSRSTDQSGSQMTVCRFERSGAIDTAFGNPATPGCRAIPSIGSTSVSNSLLVQQDGRIVLAGHDNSGTLARAVLARLLPDGTMDATFGNQGVQHPGMLLAFPEYMQNATAFTDIAQSPDGEKLVLVGTFDNGGDDVDLDILVAQFHAVDGSRDTGFNAPYGWLTEWFDLGGAKNDRATTVQVLPDGALLIGGTAVLSVFRTIPVALKYGGDGEPDPAFGSGGKQFYDIYDACPSLCLAQTEDLQAWSDGSFVIAGTNTVQGDDTDFFAMRMLPDGSLDVNFGPGDENGAGISYIDFAGSEDRGSSALLQGERVLVAGSAYLSGEKDFAIARLDHGIDGTFTLTPNAGPGGTLSPGAAQELVHSDQAEFVVAANPGFALKQITGCGGTLFGGVYTTAPAISDCSVTATFSPDLTISYDADPNGSIAGEALQTVPYGGNASAVEAVGNWGYHFAQWSDGSPDNPRHDTNVTQAIDVIALFELNLYAVAPVPGAGGELVPAMPQYVPHGGTTQFILQPEPGFAIGEVSGCPGILQGKVFTTDAIEEGCDLVATFVQSNQMYSLQYLTAGHGSISGATQQMVLSGADGSVVTALPTTGYQFVIWDDGRTDNPRHDTHVLGDIRATALFSTEPKFAVMASASGGGSVTPNGLQLASAGDTLQIAVVPDPGFLVQEIGGTCNGALVGGTFTTAPVTAHCSVTVSFANDPDFIFSDEFEHSP